MISFHEENNLIRSSRSQWENRFKTSVLLY